MARARTFIITRPAGDSARFMAAARAAGHAVIAAPLLSIEMKPAASVPERNWQAVAITSANGARGVAAHPARDNLIRARAVPVGPASSEAARAAGFTDILQAEGDVKALIRAVADNLDPAAGPVLYASGAITRGDLQGELAARGFEVTRVVFYEAVQAPALPEEAARLLRSGERALVALYSPRTARIWAALASKAGLAEQAASCAYACLSRNVADALTKRLPGARGIIVPPAPDEPSLLAALGLAE